MIDRVALLTERRDITPNELSLSLKSTLHSSSEKSWNVCRTVRWNSLPKLYNQECTCYASLLASCTGGDDSIFKGRTPGGHFLFGSILLLAAWSIAIHGLADKNHPALSRGVTVKEI